MRKKAYIGGYYKDDIYIPKISIKYLKRMLKSKDTLFCVFFCTLLVGSR